MLHHKNQTPDFSFKNLLLVFHWTEPLFTTNLSGQKHPVPTTATHTSSHDQAPTLPVATATTP